MQPGVQRSVDRPGLGRRYHFAGAYARAVLGLLATVGVAASLVAVEGAPGLFEVVRRRLLVAKQLPQGRPPEVASLVAEAFAVDPSLPVHQRALAYAVNVLWAEPVLWTLVLAGVIVLFMEGWSRGQVRSLVRPAAVLVGAAVAVTGRLGRLPFARPSTSTRSVGTTYRTVATADRPARRYWFLGASLRAGAGLFVTVSTAAFVVALAFVPRITGEVVRRLLSLNTVIEPVNVAERVAVLTGVDPELPLWQQPLDYAAGVLAWEPLWLGLATVGAVATIAEWRFGRWSR